jgi:hypothetical protein
VHVCGELGGEDGEELRLHVELEAFGVDGTVEVDGEVGDTDDRVLREIKIMDKIDFGEISWVSG